MEAKTSDAGTQDSEAQGCVNLASIDGWAGLGALGRGRTPMHLSSLWRDHPDDARVVGWATRPAALAGKAVSQLLKL